MPAVRANDTTAPFPPYNVWVDVSQTRIQVTWDSYPEGDDDSPLDVNGVELDLVPTDEEIAYFQVQLATDSGFTDIIRTDRKVLGHHKTFRVRKPRQNIFYARVRSVDELGNKSAWSNEYNNNAEVAMPIYMTMKFVPQWHSDYLKARLTVQNVSFYDEDISRYQFQLNEVGRAVLDANISSGDTTLSIVAPFDPAEVPMNPGTDKPSFTIWVEDEQMTVTSISGNNNLIWHLKRGENGTTAAAHTAGNWIWFFGEDADSQTVQEEPNSTETVAVFRGCQIDNRYQARVRSVDSQNRKSAWTEWTPRIKAVDGAQTALVPLPGNPVPPGSLPPAREAGAGVPPPEGWSAPTGGATQPVTVYHTSSGGYYSNQYDTLPPNTATGLPPSEAFDDGPYSQYTAQDPDTTGDPPTPSPGPTGPTGPTGTTGPTGPTGVSGMPSDGTPPSASPTPIVLGGVSYLYVSFDAVPNDDVTSYDIHVSTESGFEPFYGVRGVYDEQNSFNPTSYTATGWAGPEFDDGPYSQYTGRIATGTLVGTIDGTMFYIRELPDGSPLEYGVTYYVKIVAHDLDGTATPSSEAPGTLVQINHEDIAVDSIYANNINAGAITSETLAAVLVLSSKIVAGTEGAARVELGNLNQTDKGIQGFGTDGTTTFRIDAVTGDVYVSGQIVATSASGNALIVEGNAELQGAANSLAESSITTLESSLQAPSNAPVLASGWDYVTLANSTNRGYYRYGGCYTATGGSGGATPSYAFVNKNPDTAVSELIEVTAADPATVARATTIFSGTSEPFGVTKLGSHYFILYKNSSGATKIRKVLASDLTTIVADVNINADMGGGSFRQAIGDDGTDIYVVDRGAGGSYRFHQYNSTLTLHLNLTSTNYNPGAGNDDAPTDLVYRDDGSGNRWWLSTWNAASTAPHATNNVHSFNTSFSHQYTSDTNHECFPAAENVSTGGLVHDGTNFWTISYNWYLKKHTNWKWTSVSDKYWVAYSWYDSSPSTETQYGPRASITHKKRSRLFITTANLPGAPVESAKIYMIPQSTDPGATAAKYQSTVTPTAAYLDDYNSGGATGPAANGFAALGTPATLKTNSAGFRLEGDGTLVSSIYANEGALPTGELGQLGYVGSGASGVGLYAHNGTTWTHGRPFIGARLHSTGASHTSSASFQAVGFTTESYDTGPSAASRTGIADTTADDFKVPVGLAGVWTIRGHIEFVGDAGGTRRELSIVQNGPTTLSNQVVLNPAGNAISIFVEWTGVLAEGNTVWLEAFQNSGGNLAYTTGSAFHWFEAEFKGRLAAL